MGLTGSDVDVPTDDAPDGVGRRASVHSRVHVLSVILGTERWEHQRPIGTRVPEPPYVIDGCTIHRSPHDPRLRRSHGRAGQRRSRSVRKVHLSWRLVQERRASTVELEPGHCAEKEKTRKASTPVLPLNGRGKHGRARDCPHIASTFHQLSMSTSFHGSFCFFLSLKEQRRQPGHYS